MEVNDEFDDDGGPEQHGGLPQGRRVIRNEHDFKDNLTHYT